MTVLLQLSIFDNHTNFIFNYRMLGVPEFPYFRPIELGDRDIFRDIFKRYRPEVSEYSFTNLFIWRTHYKFQWSLFKKDWLMIVCRNSEDSIYAMQPVGPASRRDAVIKLLEWLREEKKTDNPRIERADERLISELEGEGHFTINTARDHFDYVYLINDLAQLSGNRYRSQRNHINRLLRSYPFSYSRLSSKHIHACIELQEKWCQLRRCEEDLNLLGEWDAVLEILEHFDILGVEGGVITIDGKIMAFTVGEMLNDTTFVVHIEKADPEIPGLYQIINQRFCEKSMQDAVYVNREQDLGLPGLRKTKMSYYPDHFVNKYSITLEE
jgi:hypothetical protein